MLELPDERVAEALELAHEVRMRWCGPEVEVEGIVCRQDRRLPRGLSFLLAVGPVRDARFARRGSTSRRWWRRRARPPATGATEFCIVAAVRGPDARLMAQVRDGVAAIQAAVEINVACSLGILTREQAEDLRDLGVHRYNHNLETARSHFPRSSPRTRGTSGGRRCSWCARWAWRSAAAGIIGMGESLEQRAEFARQLAELDPDEVPLNFLDPRPGTPFADLPRPARATRCGRSRRSGWRCRGPCSASPAGASSRSATSAPARACSAASTRVIVGNYLTTLGRSPQEDLDLLAELKMPVKELSNAL